MKDQKGYYYYPNPTNKRVRMYVRANGGEIEFRLWNQEDPKLWEEHGWVPRSVIEQAKAIYRKDGPFDPGQAYDYNLADALVKEQLQDRKNYP
jgi:hypothetical protein